RGFFLPACPAVARAAPPPPPSPPSPLSMGTGGRGCEGVADVPQQQQLPPRLLLSLSPCRTLCWERGGAWKFRGRQEGICSPPPFLLHPWGVKECGAAVGGGDLQYQPPPRPPLPSPTSPYCTRTSAVASYLLSSHSPASSSSLALCECL
ncbi:unnamed protein product, partial [Closterium sp. NIES-53]